MSISDMKDLILVSMLGPAKVGDRFTSWPLHMTLLSWFTAPSVQEVSEVLDDVLRAHESFVAKPAKRAYFGKQRLAVRLVDLSPALRNLHYSLLQMAADNNWQVKGRYVGDQFVSHVTQQKSFDAEVSFAVDSIYMVESQPQGYREVVGVRSLS